MKVLYRGFSINTEQWMPHDSRLFVATAENGKYLLLLKDAVVGEKAALEWIMQEIDEVLEAEKAP